MTFIRLKIETKRGKKYRYYYYCLRRRSRIKDGGDGKVISPPDKLIGDSLLHSKYLPFWLWDSIPVVDYIEAMIAFEMKQRKYLLPGLTWQIDWKLRKGKAITGKLKFRSSPSIDPECPNVDARSKYPKSVREYLQHRINWVIQDQDKIANEIEAIAYKLAKYNQQQIVLAQEEAKYQQWKKDPDREWIEGNTLWRYHPTYGDLTLENIEICRHNIDYWLDSYDSEIPKLVEKAPPEKRKEFKAAIIRQTEKLAASPNFLDRYACK